MKKKILIIDDEPSIRKTLGIHLHEAGYDVMSAGEGTQGLRLATSEAFDLILCDLKLPDISGLEILRTLKAQKRIIPVVVISGFIDDQMIEDVKKAGAREYLAKPFLKETLLKLLGRIFRTYQYQTLYE